jgi:hypothetical protein
MSVNRCEQVTKCWLDFEAPTSLEQKKDGKKKPKTKQESPRDDGCFEFPFALNDLNLFVTLSLHQRLSSNLHTLQS